MSKTPAPLSIMVSSTVYDKRGLLKRVFTTLGKTYGHDVWMSDRSTVPIDPEAHNFENCINAVDACDVFFGIISPHYGTGVAEKDGQSITHLELLRSIELEKPRFVLCHENIVTARVLLNTLAYDGTSLKGPDGRQKLSLKSDSFVSDLKTIDMYEAALRLDVKFKKRKNHWVQEYEDETDILNFVRTNFDPDGGNSAFLQRMAEKKASANGGAK